MKSIRKFVSIFLCIILTACTFIIGAGAEETFTYEVGKNKTYATVHNAVTAVASQTVTEATDFIIKLYPGTYTGPVFIRQEVNKNIILTGTDKDNVIITGGAYSYYKDGKSTPTATYAAIVIDGDSRPSGTEGFLIKDITFSYTAPDGASSVDIIALVRYEVRAGKGYSYAHNITLDNCTFKDDTAANKTVALRSVSSSYNVSVLNCTGIGLHSFGQGQANPYKYAIQT